MLSYWSTGQGILDRQERLGWVANVIDLLAAELRRELPEAKGLSNCDPNHVRASAHELPERSIVQQLAAELPWCHTCTLPEQVLDPEKRAWPSWTHAPVVP